LNRGHVPVDKAAIYYLKFNLVLFYLLDFIITKTIILQYSYFTYIMFTIPNRENIESSPVNE
jgi:hypothetical protein